MDSATRLDLLQQRLAHFVGLGAANYQGSFQMGHFKNHCSENFRYEGYTDDEIGLVATRLIQAGVLAFGGDQSSQLRLIPGEFSAPHSAERNLPEDIEIVWQEASRCLPSRPRGALLLLGVAIEMTIAELGERLATKLKPNPPAGLSRWQVSVRRSACIDALRSPDRLGIDAALAKRVTTALEALEGVTYQRDTATHRDPASLPDANRVQILLTTFPVLAADILSIPR